MRNRSNLPDAQFANELWVKLGLHVSPRTVRKYLPKPPVGRPRGDQRWSTFLKNHAEAIVACDFFVSVTSTFRLLYVLVVIEHRSRRLIHCNVTAHPTAAWTRQQLRQALGFDTHYDYLLHDRDSIFSRELDAAVGGFGLRILKTPPRCPMANGFCERMIGTIRRECLDWLIPLSEAHLRRALRLWVEHYNRGRPHMMLGPGVPDPPAARPTATPKSCHRLADFGSVRSKAVLGGCITSIRCALPELGAIFADYNPKMPGDTGLHAAAPRRTAGSILNTAGALWLSTGLALLLPVNLPAESPAATAPAPPPSVAPAALTADMPPQPLAAALENFARQTGLQYASVDGVVTNQQTQGAPAGLPATEALARLLEGTGLRFQLLNERIVRIVAISPGAGADEPLPSLQEVLILAHRIAKPYLAPASAKEQRALEGANAELEERIAREHLLYGHAELDHYAQAVAERLLAVDETDPSGVHVRVMKGVDANAFALSNGSIYLTTALLATLDDEAQLAAVLGHELTHYINCHALRGLREEHHERIAAVTTGAVINAVLTLISQHNGVYASPWIRPETVEIWVRAAISGYSRDLEREADDSGIRRMIAAGYDPVDALTALEHLAAQTTATPGGETPLYASHPRIEQRMASYRDLLASELAAAGGVGDRRREEYRTQLAELPLDQVELLIEAGALDRAERLLAAEIVTADSGRAEFLKGELSRKRVPQTDATVQTALLAYERAVTLGDAPVSAYRQAGLLHRLRGEPEAATVAFQTYLEHAPTAVDAPLVRIYLEELRTSSPEVKR